MEKRGAYLVIEDDKKRTDLSAFLSRHGIRVRRHRCDDGPQREEVRRLKKELSLHLRKSRELE